MKKTILLTLLLSLISLIGFSQQKSIEVIYKPYLKFAEEDQKSFDHFKSVFGNPHDITDELSFTLLANQKESFFFNKQTRLFLKYTCRSIVVLL